MNGLTDRGMDGRMAAQYRVLEDARCSIVLIQVKKFNIFQNTKCLLNHFGYLSFK